MDFIIVIIFYLLILFAIWGGANALGAFIFAPPWWSKGRRIMTVKLAIIISFPVAILMEWLFDDYY
jgi:hypothetical protein